MILSVWFSFRENLERDAERIGHSVQTHREL